MSGEPWITRSHTLREITRTQSSWGLGADAGGDAVDVELGGWRWWWMVKMVGGGGGRSRGGGC